MKKFIFLAVALLGLNADHCFAQFQIPIPIADSESDLIARLDQWNYQAELMSAPLAVVAYHLQNNLPDHNGQLISNLREAAEFYSNNTLLSFYQVEGYTSPALIRSLGIKIYPTISIYRYGKLIKTVEDIFQLQDIFPIIQEALENY